MYNPTRISLPQINQCLLREKSLPSSASVYKSYSKNWSHTKLFLGHDNDVSGAGGRAKA